MHIKGKTAFVTGGASGLGAATVKRLHGMGASIVVADMNTDTGEAIIKELGSRAVFVQMDITSPDQVKAGFDRALQEFKNVHILVHCAGTGWVGKIAGKEGPHDLDMFTKIVNINLIGTFDVCRWAAFHMQSNEPNEDGERGVIINTASIAATDPQIGQVAYCASKAGVVGMTLSIARDMSRVGIRCCTIVPGPFATPLTGMMPKEMNDALAAQIPFPKRFGKPDEYAMLAQQIVENSFLNGETIRLDGAIRMPPK
jgi:3-hydroxyacyl-CoA dehydrogenase / 3-hydroxy-2-methylbutyryl-CoA dehydrogenase